MRTEKQFIKTEYLDRLNQSAFFIVVDYKGLTMGHFTELRNRLRKVGAEIHVVKNSIFRLAAKDVGVDLDGAMMGQLAAVIGQRDISAAAKVVKTFKAEFDRPQIKFGFLANKRLGAEDLSVLADLPSLDVLRGILLGTINAPASTLVRLLATPASQLARVLQARVDKETDREKE